MKEYSDAIVASIIAIIGVVVWMLRLEGKHNQHTQDLLRHDEEIKEIRLFNNKIADDLTAIRESTAQIKGYLSMPERRGE